MPIQRHKTQELAVVSRIGGRGASSGGEDGKGPAPLDRSGQLPLVLWHIHTPLTSHPPVTVPTADAKSWSEGRALIFIFRFLKSSHNGKDILQRSKPQVGSKTQPCPAAADEMCIFQTAALKGVSRGSSPAKLLCWPASD